jgi:hypothetical protein
MENEDTLGGEMGREVSSLFGAIEGELSPLLTSGDSLGCGDTKHQMNKISNLLSKIQTIVDPTLF